MVNRLSWAAALVAGLLCAPSARAQSEPKIALKLEYEAPEGFSCPDAAELGRMIEGEFGYSVIRDDVEHVLRVEVELAGRRGFVATLSAPDLAAPDASGRVERWTGRTDHQPTCRELTYDVAGLLKAHLGPLAWPDGRPPEHLLPPPVEVVTSTLYPYPLRTYSPLLAEERDLERLTRSGPIDEERLLRKKKYMEQAQEEREERARLRQEAARERKEGEMHVMVGVGPAGLAYGLPSFGVGGSGILSFRWKRFALTTDVRGVITPIAGIGAEDLPARTSLWSGTVLPCARAKFLDICAAVSVGRVAFHLEDGGILRSTQGVIAGFGARVSGGWRISDGYHFIVYGDLMADHRSTVFSTAKSDSSEVTQQWRSPPVRIGLGIMLGFDLTE